MFSAADHTLVRATFQLVPGLGPTRERLLWQAGITDWADADRAGRLLPAGMGDKLARAVACAESALHTGDLATLGRMWPGCEVWRLYGAFADRTLFLDIESAQEEGVTAVGLFDDRGPRILLGREVARVPDEIPPDCLLCTFNGSSFDVPVLRRAFPEWTPPAAHIDLRHVYVRLGEWGGLKLLEDQMGIGRPDHLRAVDGSAIIYMWRHAQHGNRQALRLLAEYNLYDTINLRTLLVMAHNRLAAQTGLPARAQPDFFRGDVLYDVTKILLAL